MTCHFFSSKKSSKGCSTSRGQIPEDLKVKLGQLRIVKDYQEYLSIGKPRVLHSINLSHYSLNLISYTVPLLLRTFFSAADNSCSIDKTWKTSAYYDRAGLYFTASKSFMVYFEKYRISQWSILKNTELVKDVKSLIFRVWRRCPRPRNCQL